MKRLTFLALAAIALVVLTASTGVAGTRPNRTSPFSSETHALIPAKNVGPSRGGAGAPRGYLPLHAREFAQAKAAANARAGLQSRRPRPGGGGGAATVFSQPNVSPSFNGAYDTSATPPDSTGAIGPDRYLEGINLKYALYTKTGSLINSGSLGALTDIPTGLFGYGLSDPQMMWDAKTQRFYYAAIYYDFFFSDNGIAVGWSKTATPASSNDFCKFAIPFGSDLPDYPKLGDSSDFLMFGYNLFGNFASTYDGSGVVTLNKPSAGSDCPSTSAFRVYGSGTLHNADGSLAATPVPANLVDDANGAGYVVANADLSVTASADFASVYALTTAGADANGIPIPSISAPATVTVPTYSMPSNAPQRGSAYLLDTLDGRFEAAVAAVDPGEGGRTALWTAHAVYGGEGVAERWYEIDPGAGSLLQSGTASSSTLFVWNGAISPDRANNGSTAAFGDSMAMSVSTSSATTYPAIQLLWKNRANAQSALTPLVQANGSSIDSSCSDTSPCRWGDYSGASPDPAASGPLGKVWLTNQYNVASASASDVDWRTWLFAVTPN